MDGTCVDLHPPQVVKGTGEYEVNIFCNGFSVSETQLLHEWLEVDICKEQTENIALANGGSTALMSPAKDREADTSKNSIVSPLSSLWPVALGQAEFAAGCTILRTAFVSFLKRIEHTLVFPSS